MGISVVIEDLIDCISVLPQAKIMEMDKCMRYTHHKMKALTSNLNEELAMVQYLFSDKTGTLTQNQMVFHSASVGDIYHVEKDNPGLAILGTAILQVLILACTFP